MNISAVNLFFEVLSDIRINYPSYGFFVERDLVWTIQKKMSQLISQNKLPYKIYNDYPIEKGEHRSRSVDLVVVNNDTQSNIQYKKILDGSEMAELIIEFKYEPSKNRNDICIHKLPVTFWSNISDDIERVSRFFDQSKTKSAIAIFVDENSRYRNEKYYKISSLSKWEDWGEYGTDIYKVSALITEFHKY